VSEPANGGEGIRVLLSSDPSVNSDSASAHDPPSLHQPLLPLPLSVTAPVTVSALNPRQRPTINKLLQASPSGRLVLSQWEIASPRVNNEDSLRGYS